MESAQETPKSSQCDANSQIIDFNDTNWNCVTSQAFIKSYIQYLLTIDEKKDGNDAKTENESTQDGKRALTDASTSSDTKRMNLDCEHPSTGKHQLTTIIKTNDWHQKLCKCLKCLKMYEGYNIEFLFGIKTIEWLPTETLLKIFTHLMPSDRRIASECCKRFLDIWLSDDFIDDRRLVFHCCVLDPEREPLSVFSKSSRNYQHLVIGDVTIREELVFAGNFGKTITTVEFHHFVRIRSFNNISSLLSQFPNLKIIKVEKLYVEIDFSEMPTTLELLVISGHGRYQGNELNRLQCYLDKTPDSFRLELNVRIDKKQIPKFTESQRNKIQSLHLRLAPYEKISELPHFGNLKCLKLSFYFSSYYGTKEILDNLKEQFPALKDLSMDIDLQFLPTLNAYNTLKEELSRLRIFENLTELTLNAHDKCFFVHEAFLNKNLKTLEIYPAKDPCVTCFETMVKSFPNLENLTCDFKVTNDHWEELATNTPKLKCLTLHERNPSLSLPKLSEMTFGNSVELKTIETFPLMLNLRKLELELRRFEVETVKMFEKLPGLEDLRLFCDDIDDNQVSLLFDTMSKSLKRLKNFRFHCYKKPELKQEIYVEIVDVMAKNCNNLRHIRVCDDYITMEVCEKIFNKCPSLRSIDRQWLK